MYRHMSPALLRDMIFEMLYDQGVLHIMDEQ